METSATSLGSGGDLQEDQRYEAPLLIEVGGVYELTLTGGGHCWHDKKWGGSDGVKFLNITIPISSC